MLLPSLPFRTLNGYSETRDHQPCRISYFACTSLPLAPAIALPIGDATSSKYQIFLSFKLDADLLEQTGSEVENNRNLTCE